MKSELEERLDVAGQIMHRLIEQNLSLSSRVIALENLVALSVAQHFDKGTPDLEGLSRFSSQVSAAATRIADFVRTELPADDHQIEAVPRSMERVVSMARDICTSRENVETVVKRPFLRLVDTGNGS
jgi:hypothetical protein